VTYSGLDKAVHRLTGATRPDHKIALDVGRRLVQHVQEVLAIEGRRRLVDTALLTSDEVAWNPAALEQPLRAVGRLHAIAGTGTVTLVLPEDQRITPEQVVELLQVVRQRTEIVRLQLVRRRGQEDQQRLPLP
jgi:hypothetical protein